jgi:hypothetical protein
MSLDVPGEVTKMNVKTKKFEEKGEDGTKYQGVQRIGEVTIQFDADEVNVGEIANLINGRYSMLSLSDPKMPLD